MMDAIKQAVRKNIFIFATAIITGFTFAETQLAGPNPPADLVNFIKQELKGLKLLPKERFDPQWYKERTDKYSSPSFLSLDFNGDTQRDYALLLQDKDGNLSAWLFLGDKNTFTSKELWTLNKVPKNELKLAIDILRPGLYPPLVHDLPEVEPIRSEYEGVQISREGRRKEAWYWNKGKAEFFVFNYR